MNKHPVIEITACYLNSQYHIRRKEDEVGQK